MPQKVASLYAELAVDDSKLRDGLRRATQDIRQTGAEMQGLGRITALDDLGVRADKLRARAVELEGTAHQLKLRLGDELAMGADLAGNRVQMMASRFALAAGQMTGAGRAFTVIAGEGATGLASLASVGTLAGIGLAGVGVMALKVGWDLGAAALKFDAVAKGGKDAKTSVDQLGEAFADLKLAIGRDFAPAVDQAALGMAILTERAAGNRAKELILVKQQLEAELAKGIKGTTFAGAPENQNFPEAGGYLPPIVVDEEAIKTQLAGVNAELTSLGVVFANVDSEAQQFAADMASIARMDFSFLPGQLGMLTPAQRNQLSNEGRGISQMQAAVEEGNAQAQLNAYLEGERKRQQLAQEGARKAEAAWQKAVDAMKGYFQGAFSEAAGNLKGLLPGTNFSPLAPGANGPFEAVYRAADVYQNLGKPTQGKDTAKWAAMYGLTPESAYPILQSFAMGNYGPAMEAGLIDKAKLDEYAKQQQAAANWQQNFLNQVTGGGAAAALVSGISGGATAVGATVGAGGAAVVNNVVTVNMNGMAYSVTGGNDALGRAIADAISQALRTMSVAEARQSTTAPASVPGAR